jgi:hypothetical protein
MAAVWLGTVLLVYGLATLPDRPAAPASVHVIPAPSSRTGLG